jgi:hypothetical protein
MKLFKITQGVIMLSCIVLPPLSAQSIMERVNDLYEKRAIGAPEVIPMPEIVDSSSWDSILKLTFENEKEALEAAERYLSLLDDLSNDQKKYLSYQVRFHTANSRYIKDNRTYAKLFLFFPYDFLPIHTMDTFPPRRLSALHIKPNLLSIDAAIELAKQTRENWDKNRLGAKLLSVSILEAPVLRIDQRAMKIRGNITGPIRYGVRIDYVADRDIDIKFILSREPITFTRSMGMAQGNLCWDLYEMSHPDEYLILAKTVFKQDAILNRSDSFGYAVIAVKLK